ncbi:hypothetical protein AR689_13305 [Arthrobacter sp. EpRS71]|nr:hypothetical protein AR689_13305 [Arthrobacter sp. EpRS71]
MLLKAVPGTESICPQTVHPEHPSRVSGRLAIHAPSILTSESVIHVFNTPALTWTLTLVLVAGGIHYALQAIRSRRITGRINNSLHALMHTLMAAMLWDAAVSSTLLQIAILASAALWFIIQAVARPQFRTFCAGTGERIKCLYHGLTMAAAALMIAMMAIPAVAPLAPSDSAKAGSGMSSHGHHASSAALGPATASQHTIALAVALTVAFGTAAVIFLALLLRRRQRPAHQATERLQITGHSARVNHVLEAAGATVMALMFATFVA